MKRKIKKPSPDGPAMGDMGEKNEFILKQKNNFFFFTQKTFCCFGNFPKKRRWNPKINKDMSFFRQKKEEFVLQKREGKNKGKTGLEQRFRIIASGRVVTSERQEAEEYSPPSPKPLLLFLFPEDSIESSNRNTSHRKMKFFIVLVCLFSASVLLSQPTYDMIFAEDFEVPVTAKTDTGVFFVLKTYMDNTTEVCCFYRNDVKTKISYVALREFKIVQFNITDDVPVLCVGNDGRCGMTLSGKVDPTCPTPVETFQAPTCLNGSSIITYKGYRDREKTICGETFKSATRETGYTLSVYCINQQ